MTGTAFLAGLMVALGWQVFSFREGAADQRVRSLAGSAVLQPPGADTSAHTTRAALLVLTAGATGVFIAGVMSGVLLAAVAAALRWVLHRRVLTVRRREVASMGMAVAPCADLLAACLTAGATPEEAVTGVCAAIDGPLRGQLMRVGAALRTGADAGQAWAEVDAVPALAPVARAFVRAAQSGAPIASTVAAVADEQRRAQRWAAEATARRAGVLAVGPLALCFLPAFVLIGVVPIVVGIATEVLTAW